MHHILSLFGAVIDTSHLPKAGTDPNALNTILNTIWAITGSISLLMITVAGFRYILSRGDPNTIAQSKNTILYAVIGLVVAISGFLIVGFVLGGL